MKVNTKTTHLERALHVARLMVQPRVKLVIMALLLSDKGCTSEEVQKNAPASRNGVRLELSEVQSLLRSLVNIHVIELRENKFYPDPEGYNIIMSHLLAIGAYVELLDPQKTTEIPSPLKKRRNNEEI